MIDREICRAIGCRYSIAPCVLKECIHRVHYKPVESLISDRERKAVKEFYDETKTNCTTCDLAVKVALRKRGIEL